MTGVGGDSYLNFPVVIGFLKAIRGLLILVALLLAVIPLVMLVSLLTGGTGYGLCVDGLAKCDTAFLTGPAVAARICLALLMVAAAVRVISRIVSRVEKHRRWEDARAYYSGLVGWTEDLR